MPDRATYLSRTLLSRIRNLEASRSESADPEGPTMMASAERVVSKVLAVEEGITDGATVQLGMNGTRTRDRLRDRQTL